MFEDVAGGGTGGAAVATPPVATPPSTDSAASSAAASVAAPAAASPESPNIKQLREQYEATKGKLEPWEKTFKNTKPEDVAVSHQVFSNMQTEALELGEKLGYDAQEIRDFMRKDPFTVIQHLRQKAAAGEPTSLSPADQRKMIEAAVDKRLAPIEQERRTQQIAVATQKFNGEFDRLFKEAYKDGAPDDVREAIMEMTNQLHGNDREACQRLLQGKVSDVAKYFSAANTRVTKLFTSMLEQERKRTGTGVGQPVPEKAKGNGAMETVLSTGQRVRDLFRI